MSLGTRIRYYRLKLGWKLEDLSDKSGVDIGRGGVLRAHYTTCVIRETRDGFQLVELTPLIR